MCQYTSLLPVSPSPRVNLQFMHTWVGITLPAAFFFLFWLHAAAQSTAGNAGTTGPCEPVGPRVKGSACMGVKDPVSQAGRAQHKTPAGAHSFLHKQMEARSEILLFHHQQISWYHDSTPKRPQYPCCDGFSGITHHCFAFSRLILADVMQEEYHTEGITFTCILQSPQSLAFSLLQRSHMVFQAMLLT